VERTLAPYRSEGRVRTEGPPVRMAPTAAVTVNLAFHELATNAVKYGALSVQTGRVDVSWRIDRTDRARPMVEINWVERGGPPVRPPAKRGFGSRLIERGLVSEFSAEVRLDFAPEGVECQMRLPFVARVVAL
jgi:two-component sensor histidine kinase